MELVLQQLEEMIPTASIQILLQKRTDMNLTPAQTNAVRLKAALSLSLGDMSSPAEQLMRQLGADVGMHCVVLAAHCSMSDLITIQQTRKDKFGKRDTVVGDVGNSDDEASILQKLS
jgi:hypothetical protein